MTYPTIMPALTLDFQNSQQLDPRVTFSRASSATYINSAGQVASAAEHEARFDHDPVTGECLGLLVEESRTNSQKWSSDFSQTSSYSLINNGDGAVPVLDSTLYEAPDGSATAQRWTLQITDTTDGGNQSGIQAGTSGIPSGAYVTVWAKSATGADQTVFLTSQANDTFTVTSKWQRFDLGPRSIIPFRAFARGTYTNAVVDILLWGVQIEAGSFATSLIPTSGSTVTRSADIVQMTGDNFSSWYNQSEGTLFAQWVSPDTKQFSSPAIIKSSAVKNSPRIYVYAYQGNKLIGMVKTPSESATILTTSYVPNTKLKTAIAYNTSSQSSTFNGNTPQSANISAAIPTMIKMDLGDVYSTNDRYSNHHISRLSYYNERLTDAELQTLTL